MGSYLKINPIRLGKFNNAEYTNFMNRFTLANKLDAGKTVRLELDEQYDDLVTITFVTSVATPSKEATDFVVYMNKLIADTETAYNRVSLSVGRKRKRNKQNERLSLRG